MCINACLECTLQYTYIYIYIYILNMYNIVYNHTHNKCKKYTYVRLKYLSIQIRCNLNSKSAFLQARPLKGSACKKTEWKYRQFHSFPLQRASVIYVDRLSLINVNDKVLIFLHGENFLDFFDMNCRSCRSGYLCMQWMKFEWWQLWVVLAFIMYRSRF